MHFNNQHYRNDFERLQIELLKAEVELKKEKAEEQRIQNVANRRLNGVPERILPATTTSLGAPTGFWGGIGAPSGLAVTNNHNSLY